MRVYDIIVYTAYCSDDEDTQKAFQKHFDTQLNLYQEMVSVLVYFVPFVWNE